MDGEESDVNERSIEPKRFFERFLPEQTIIYMQYCLLRIPFLLFYDYLFSHQFHTFIESILKYSIELFEQQHEILFKPITYLLRSYLFQLLVHLNLVLSIPVLGKYELIRSEKLCLFRRSHSLDCFIIMFGSTFGYFLQLFHIIFCYLFLLSNQSPSGY